MGAALEPEVEVGEVDGAGRGVRARTGPWRVLRYRGRGWKGKGGGQEAGTAGVVRRVTLGAWTGGQSGDGETCVCLIEVLH